MQLRLLYLPIMKNIELLVRAIIRHNGKILVCKKTEKAYYFFPGGHIDYDENTERALRRELKEELGLTIKRCSFIGGSEHRFVEDGKKHHEINLVFEVVPKKLAIKSKEKHLQFFLFDRDRLSKEKVYLKLLSKAILRWLKDKKIFWVN